MTIDVLMAVRALQRQVADLAKQVEAQADVQHLGPPLVPYQVERIIDLVARHYGLTRAAIMSKARPKHIAFARHVAMFLCDRLLCLSSGRSAALFGRADHGTVLHAVKAIERRMNEDESFAVSMDILGNAARGELARMLEQFHGPEQTHPISISH